MAENKHTHFEYKIVTILIVLIAMMQVFTANGQENATPPQEDDSLHFPIQDHKHLADSIIDHSNSINLEDPSNYHKTIEYDPESGHYYFKEQVGGQDIRNPAYMTMEEYLDYKSRQQETDYWKQRLDALSMFNHKPKLPTLYKEGIFDRLFGGNTISVKPQGNLDLTFGGSWQNMQNPNLIQSARKYGIFNFDMNMNVNLVAQIGEKLKLNISNNTKPSFGEQNTQKIGYTGKDDEIIKKIEAGNVSFPLKSRLLTGPLSLFGVKAQLQFGKLFVTGVISKQKSQRKTLTVQGGAQTQSFKIKADEYEENKNFLLGQYFHDHYETALQNFPVINSQVNITRIDVWITNKSGSTQGIRDVLSFMDLGEKNPYHHSFTDAGSKDLPDNRANRLYELILQNPGMRTQSLATQGALALGLTNGQDFQRSTMRQLNPSEYSFQPQLGYISLNTQVNPDDVLAVAYRYTYNGKVYQVGEFPEDLPPDSTSQKVLFLKLLKGATSGRPDLPTWDLMMKNVYSIGYGGNISSKNFILNVMYQDPSGGEKRYLPDGPSAGIPLISLLNLDRLNSQNDPAPDGVFDFVEGITINSQQGKVIFPQLEPFNNGLKPSLGGNANLERKYLYPMLYDSTKVIAQQFQQNNRFVIEGSYEGASGGSEIRLGGYNIPEGSVSVTAGGQRLSEGTDYQVNYSSGTVKILNQGILSSGIPITISFEDNATFGFVQQNFWGARFDYFANNHLTLGGTIMRLTERPYTQKVQFGNDPIKNTVAGLDANYQNEFPALTRALDKLPFYSTTAPSLISLSGEVAGIFPGHQKFINALDPEGSVYIDDFEGASSSVDLRTPPTSWHLASTPFNAIDENGQQLFPEADNQDLTNGENRAKIAWYMLAPDLVDGYSGTPDNIKADTVQQSYWRLVNQTDLFPKRDIPSIQSFLPTFDLGYYPSDRGPYNFDSKNVGSNGQFLNPQSRWGGIQRSIGNYSSDFEASNVEYITFWVLDPFLYNPNNNGYLYIDLGNVSEDILKDGRLSFENGIPYPKDLTKLDKTVWGYIPRFQQQITNSFDNDPEARKVQDVGYDELDDNEEKDFYKDFLSAIQTIVNPTVFQKLENDPASDNYHYYRGSDYDQEKRNALTRYKNFNNPHGNSPIADLNSEYVSSGTSIPESEDLNGDNTLNETEAYFQYRIKLTPNMSVGDGFIADKKTINVKQLDGRRQDEVWYQYKIPIHEYDHVVGGIGDFRSIKFIRMFLTGFQDSTILRFAQLQLDRNNWRRYLFSLTSPGENIPKEDLETTSFSLTSVSLEENYERQPIPYRIPPGVSRQSSPGGITGQNLQQDEQSLALQICGLKDGDARAVFKELSLDMRQYKFLRMFVHAESVPNVAPIKNGDLVAFIRMGSDFTNNYYEYQLPLQVTPPGSTDASQIWPTANELNVELSKLVAAKTERNNKNIPSYLPYEVSDGNGYKIIVVGNPNLADVNNVMLGVSNPKKTLNTPGDDGQRKCAEIWFDELRMAGLEEKAGYAAAGEANIQLADLGNIHLGSSMHTNGYGNIDQKVDQRFKDNFYTYDASANLNFGKLLPKSWGLQLPVFVAYTQMVSNPIYNPYDKDVLLNEQLSSFTSPRQRDSLRRAAQDFNSITSFNLTNIRYLGNPKKQGKVTMPWSLKNFDLSYSYNRNFKHNPNLEIDEMVEQRLNIGYSYTLKSKSYQPFRKIIKSKSKWWLLVKDFNFSPLPSSFTFRNDLHRLFGTTQIRNIDDGPYRLPSTYFKNFVWERTYNLRWELTRSLSFNYAADNQSRIDEPYGPINTSEEKDSVLHNLSKFGRSTYFSQTLNATYKLPTNKIPILDWTNITATYISTYNWTGASRLAYDLGNIIANTQTKQINGDFNFTRLYNKSRWLRAINTPKNNRKNPFNAQQSISKSRGLSATQKAGATENNTNQKTEQKPEEKKPQAPILPPRPEKEKIEKSDVPHSDTMDKHEINKTYRAMKKTERKKFRKEIRAWRLKRSRITPEISEGLRVSGRLITMLKRVNVNYSEISGTILPGFMDSTRFFGANNRSDNPWYGFAFGMQPNREWFDRQAELNRISRDSIFNGQMQQTYAQHYNIGATLEPFPDLRIDLTWSKDFSKNYSETFKYDYDIMDYQHFSPYSLGTFSVSYIGLKTLFTPTSANEPSSLYEQFLKNRQIISKRLGAINPYTNGLPDPNDPDYQKGYTEYAQNVLIPAFLSAYSGQDVNTIPLINSGNENIRSNPFKGYFPRPNWRLTYNGLAKLPAFRDKITTFNLTHAYTGTLSMNSFVSSFYYRDLLGLGFPSFIDSNSNNYIPFFSIPNITITENLSPLIGVDIAFKNGLSLSAQFNKSRMLSLSLIDYQVSETKSTEIVIGGGTRLKGLTLPFTVFGVRRLKNDINIRIDLGYRNDITNNSYLAQNVVIPTRGQKVITISPSIDYIINDKLQIRLFYTRRQSIPALSNSYPITTTDAGVTLRFLFAPQ